jgi:stage II sporulation protein AA (anti-sigma F factor antagonist)
LEQFSVEVRTEDSTLVVACAGEMDITNAPGVEEAVARSLDDVLVSTVRLDWSGLTFMDSSGIRLLMRIMNMSKAREVDVLWDLSPAARRALDAVGIHDGLLREYRDRPAEEE